jgi:RNA polymerase sigma-70 factor (ECF subfamily)
MMKHSWRRPARDQSADRVFLANVCTGDERAFRWLWRRHTPTLRRVALRLMGGREDEADDVVQDTWIRAVERASTFRGESSLSTWLCGIVAFVARERWRGDRRWVHGASEATDGPEGADLGIDVAQRLDLEGALARLPLHHRAVIVLHDVEGFTHAEIAEQLGIAVGTSKVHLFRARRALRARLSTEETVHDG